MKPTDTILEQLKAIGCDPHRNGRGWVATCPAHDDRQSSLLIRQDNDGAPVLECSAGCSLESIINSMSAPNASTTPPIPPENLHHQESATPKTDASKKLTYGLNDLYHARKIVNLYGHDIRYCRDLGGFFVWDDRRWTHNKYGNVWRMAIHAAWDTYREQLRTTTVPKERSRLHKWVTQAESRNSIEGTLKHLQERPEIIAIASTLDSDPWLLNVNNNTIDLRTGQLREHRPDSGHPS